MYVSVVAKVYWRIKYTLAPKFEANVCFSPKIQTWRLMCTLSPNLETKVNVNKKRKPDKINFFLTSVPSSPRYMPPRSAGSSAFEKSLSQ